MATAVSTVDGWVARRESRYVTVTPAHAIMEAYSDPSLRRILNASGLTTPDGMAVVWLLRRYGHRQVERVYGPDLMLAVCEHGLARGLRHFLLGGDPETAAGLSHRLRARFPGLIISGIHSPPFGQLTPDDDTEAVRSIRAAPPDIVWVGLGSPRQERWMAAHVGQVVAPVLIGVGAAFDFLSGRKPQAPRWIQRAGMEWLFRLASEPRRLWPRYRRYPHFILLAVGQLLGWKVYPVDT